MHWASREALLVCGSHSQGNKPADMPVQQPTHFRFVVNLRAAKTIGLAIPESVLALADEVIE